MRELTSEQITSISGAGNGPRCHHAENEAGLPALSPAPRHEASPPARELLFRPEVVAERQTQWLGTVLLEPRFSAALVSIAALLAAAAVLALLVFGSYTSKARISGWLVPKQGLARIFTPQAGVVTRVHAHEGMKVTKGMPLLSLSAEVRSEAFGATRKEIVRRLEARRESTVASKAVQQRLFEQKAADLRQRLEALDSEQKHLAREIDLHRARLGVSEEALMRERAMRARDLISLTRLLRAEQDNLEQAGRLQALERSQANLQREQAQVQGALHELPIQRQAALHEIERNAAGLEQELAQAEANREIVISAPYDGVVTAIQAEPGSNAVANLPLMSIVPSGSDLEAQLFSPSRGIGFVRPGQRVLLRYQAFPYQKFGLYEGVVTNVSRTAIAPSELAYQLSGLTSLSAANEPVYRITVALAQQTATAYGEAIPLQPGMQIDADVMIETRRLIEWVFDPLYTLTGRLQG
jgi:membrane fusion protein